MCAVFDSLPHGVMVAPQILNLLVKVRVLMRQPLKKTANAVFFALKGMSRQSNSRKSTTPQRKISVSNPIAMQYGPNSQKPLPFRVLTRNVNEKYPTAAERNTPHISNPTPTPS